MDIVDILLARSLTPQGRIETYANQAQEAVKQAQSAVSTANNAVSNITTITEQTEANNALAEQTLQETQSALDNLQQTLDDLVADIDINEQLDQLTFDTSGSVDTLKYATNLIATFPDNSTKTVPNVSVYYRAVGDQEDGGVTPKAVKTYITNALADLPASGAAIHLDPDDHDHITIVGSSGELIASNIKEDDLINLLLKSDTYEAINAVGVGMDYENKTFYRLQGALNKTKGADFDQYSMYGGRMRCNVSDDGVIRAFYGDNSYRDDGSNGQVLIYQPKFYYQRIPMKTEISANGTIIRHERLFISSEKQAGFVLHPVFINESGEEIDYVLLPAYEGYVDSNGKLSSIGGVQPTNNMTSVSGEQYAQARGAGWHITTMQAESAGQMLQVIEYGSANGQTSLEKGICTLTDSGKNNMACLTGSTAALGNTTGVAESSTNVVNGVSTTYTTAGKRAISYRGMENPWGNIWHTVGNVLIHGDGASRGGIPCICSDFNYGMAFQSNYHPLNFSLPGGTGWISAMGWDVDYSWAFFPIECSDAANSALPIGDNLWSENNLNGDRLTAVGGNWRFDDSTGLFFYACDQPTTRTDLHTCGASLMYIPTKNNIYNNNIRLWKTKWNQGV